jgi:cyclophilin family peptidyl-prolyl cis-trans isomerase/HEAT repeat protein
MKQVHIRSVILTLLLVAASLAQSQPERKDEERQGKVEQILRIQDLRTPHDSTLIHLLSDSDPLVRKRAVLACGSLQDTSVLGLLTRALTDPEPEVQHAAAFAIGQTGTQLSIHGKELLEEDLLSNRLAQTSAGERLVEEIGKFGTSEALHQLMVRMESVSPLQHQLGVTRAIARFAIRKVVSDDAIRFLLRFLLPPESTTWDVVYALQRMPDHPLIRAHIEQIILLCRNKDPLVRASLATILGQIREERTCFEPLLKMAEFDNDWRVRVNALRALSGFDIRGKDQLIGLLRRAFFDGNPHISQTAIECAGSSNADPVDSSSASRELFSQLLVIAENRSGDFLWNLQAEASRALAKRLGARALPTIRGALGARSLLNAQLYRAAGLTGAPDAFDFLAPAIGSHEPVVVCAAIEGLLDLIRHERCRPEETRAAVLRSLESSDVAVVTTAASALGDSLLLHEDSVEPLIARLSGLRVPDDIEAMQEIAGTLGRLHDTRAIDPLIALLKQPDRTVALAAAGSLKAITGNGYTGLISSTSEPLYTDFDFAFLRSLPPIVSMIIETSRGEIAVDLDRDAAPFTVLSFIKLATQRRLYRGRTFHRVVPNFVVQGGDPRGDGWGGPGYTLRSEFSPERFETGTLGLASAGKDTEGSQFFITHSPQPHLDGRYTIFGRVIAGQEIVDRLLVDDRILDVTMAPFPQPGEGNRTK